jgi:ribonuclease HI
MIEVYCDGSCSPNPGQMKKGVYIERNGSCIFEKAEDIGYGTNNIAEFEALLWGIEESGKFSDEAEIYTDSQITIQRLSPAYKPIDSRVKKMIQKYNKLKRDNFRIVFIHREENKSDRLVNFTRNRPSALYNVWKKIDNLESRITKLEEEK